MLPRFNLNHRLLGAIGFMTILTLLVCLVATYNWHRLEQRIEILIHNNLPTLTQSYALERETFQLQSALYQLVQGPDFLIRKQALNRVDEKLQALKTTLVKMPDGPYRQPLQIHYNNIEMHVAQYTNTTNERHQLYLKGKTLHQNFTNNHNQITHILTQLSQNTYHHTDKKQKTQIGRALLLENKLYQQIQPIFIPKNHMDFSPLLVQAIETQSEIKSILTSLALMPQINKTLTPLLNQQRQWITHDGLISQHQTERQRLNQQLNFCLEQINQNLLMQERILNQWVTLASENLQSINKSTKSAINLTYGFLIALVTVAIASAILLMIYLIKRGVITRLHRLTQYLESVNQGNYHHHIDLTGHDEIGQIGDQLNAFCLQQQAMQKSNALNFINNTEASLITCNLHGDIESINPQAQNLFHHKDFETPVPFWSLFSEKAQNQLRPIFLQYQDPQPRAHSRLTITHQTAEHTLYLRLDLRLFEQDHQKKVIVTITDVTEQENTTRWLESRIAQKTQSLQYTNQKLRQEIEERKRIEQDLRQTQDDLIQAAKMAMVGQTMTSLAHEINQPLSALSTYLFTLNLAIDQKNFASVSDQLKKMTDLIGRMRQIIQTLRTFSKRQSSVTPLSNVNLRQGLEDAFLLIKNRLTNPNIRLDCQISTNYQVMANAVNLEQVWVNVLINACDAIANQTQREIKIDVLQATDTHLWIGIEDSGKGFDHALMTKIFTPFTTTKDVGLGLGLTICRSLLERMNGEIALASSRQKGALIVIKLQRANDDSKL